MIRRLLVAVALVVGATALFSGTASADAAIPASGGNIACVYALYPLSVGACVGI